jgi:hypothetical protein
MVWQSQPERTVPRQPGETQRHDPPFSQRILSMMEHASRRLLSDTIGPGLIRSEKPVLDQDDHPTT